MNRKITITVTANDIRKGTPDNDIFCPVAFAISRAVEPLFFKDTIDEIRVGYEYAEIKFSDGEKNLLKLPEIAKNFVTDFDQYFFDDGNEDLLGEVFKPFTFTLTGC